MVSYTFTKSEKLCSRKIIGEIFQNGKTFFCFPLKVVWIEYTIINDSYPAQVAFSVPKKNFKRACDRNMIRRKMRESYRYLKGQLYDFLRKGKLEIAVMIVFAGKEEASFSELQSAMSKALLRLEQEIKQDKNKTGN